MCSYNLTTEHEAWNTESFWLDKCLISVKKGDGLNSSHVHTLSAPLQTNLEKDKR